MKYAIALLQLPIALVKLAVATAGLLLIWCDTYLFELSNRLIMRTSDKLSWAADVKPQPASIKVEGFTLANSVLEDILSVLAKGSDASIDRLRVLLEQNEGYQGNLSEWRHALAVDRPTRRENLIRIEYALAIIPTPWKDTVAVEIKRLREKIA